MRKFLGDALLSEPWKLYRKYTLRFVACIGLVLFMIIGLTSCMYRPWEGYNAGYKYDPNVPFLGAAPVPNATISIEAWVPPGVDSAGFWKEIGTATASTGPVSQFGQDWYLWTADIIIPEYLWSLEEGDTQAKDGTILYWVDLRAKIKGSDIELMTMNDDGVVCFAQNRNAPLPEFITNCKSKNSPIVRIIASYDYHQECVDLINEIRKEEGLEFPDYELDRNQAKEKISDKDAKRNYKHDDIAHYSVGGCIETKTNCTPSAGQNDCNYSKPVPVMDSYLRECIYDDMYKKEKECYENYPDNCGEEGFCECGHYKNLVKRLNYKSVSCGFYIYEDEYGRANRVRSIQNFWQGPPCTNPEGCP